MKEFKQFKNFKGCNNYYSYLFIYAQDGWNTVLNNKHQRLDEWSDFAIYGRITKLSVKTSV